MKQSHDIVLKHLINDIALHPNYNNLQEFQSLSIWESLSDLEDVECLMQVYCVFLWATVLSCQLYCPKTRRLVIVWHIIKQLVDFRSSQKLISNSVLIRFQLSVANFNMECFESCVDLLLISRTILMMVIAEWIGIIRQRLWLRVIWLVVWVHEHDFLSELKTLTNQYNGGNIWSNTVDH